MPLSGWGALRALKELRRKDTLKPALEALRDADAAVRVQAIGVIGFLKLEKSIPALTASTGDADAHVRRTALRKEAAAALGEIANADAEPFLALVANDPDPEVRKNSRWALQQIAARKAKAQNSI